MSVFLLSKVFIGLRRSLQVEVESCGFVGLGESRCVCVCVCVCVCFGMVLAAVPLM